MAKTISDLNKSQKEIINDESENIIDRIEALEQGTAGSEDLLTNNKTIVGAINELFQSANNGKELIASAIGEPVSADDTFSAMSDDINGLLSTFKTNMMNNGVTVNSGDKFKSLIDKIATMVEEGSGKRIQYEEFVINDSHITEGTNALNLTVYNLKFKPSFKPTLFLIKPTEGVSSTNVAIRRYFFYNGDDHIQHIRINSNSNRVDQDNYTLDNQYYYVNDNEIFICLDGLNIATVEEYTYYAIGVGEEDTTLRDSLADILKNKGVDVTEEDDMASLISKVEQRLEEGEVFKEGTTNCIDLSMLPYRHHNDDGTLSTRIITRLFTFLNKGTVTFKFNITGWSNTVYAMVYLEQYNVNHELVYRSDLFSAQGSDRTNACSVTMTVSKGDYVFIVPHSSSEGGYISDMKMYYD